MGTPHQEAEAEAVNWQVVDDFSISCFVKNHDECQMPPRHVCVCTCHEGPSSVREPLRPFPSQGFPGNKLEVEAGEPVGMEIVG